MWVIERFVSGEWEWKTVCGDPAIASREFNIWRNITPDVAWRIRPMREGERFSV
jgi:hypothetical protein